MKPWVLLAVALATSIARGEGARIAVHPLAVPGLTEEQAQRLSAFFDIRLARTPTVQFVQSSDVDRALAAQRGCAPTDVCLRQLARGTDSMYAVHSQLNRTLAGGELQLTARVVRRDGTLIRQITRGVQPVREAKLVETARALIGEVVEALSLQTLPATMPPVDIFSGLPAPPLLSAHVEPPAPASTWRSAGVAVTGVGLLTLVGGAALYGMGEGNGEVSSVEGRAGTVMIPLGAVLAVGGALIAFLPDHRP